MKPQNILLRTPQSALPKPYPTRPSLRLFLLLLAVILLALPAVSFGQIYVDVDASATGADGMTWGTAFPTLQDALNEVGDGNQIWVAEGTYYPDEGDGQTDNDRTATFQLKNGVKIYGGFAGSETALNQRDWTANPTILSGDIDGGDNFAGNAYHVVTGSGTDNTALLDGFTITGGNADGFVSNGLGGGMFNEGGSPTLRNLTFSGNQTAGLGGGMFNEESSPTLTNVAFTGNSASDDRGGGMYNIGGSSTLTNVTFTGNSANNGGGMYNIGDSSTLTNVTFTGNSASDGGGGMWNSGSPTLTNVTFSGNEVNLFGGGMYNFNNSSPTLTNVTFAGNTAEEDGGGMYNDIDSSPTLTNLILWGNQAGRDGDGIFNDFATPTITYSLVQGQNPAGEGNLDGTDSDNDPLFVTPVNPNNAPTTAGDLRLQEGSPAIHAGSNDALPADENDLDGDGDTDETIPYDLAGNDRVQEGAVDLGAYESPFAPPIMPGAGNILYVDISKTDEPGHKPTGSSWDNALPELRDALVWANNEWDAATDGILQIWVADGVYTPTDNTSERSATFQLQSGVEIYGGFKGNEADLNQRNWAEYPAVLSGDIDGDDDDFDPGTDSDDNPDTPSQTDHINGSNSYSVVTGSGTDETAHLDGFTITGGNADGDGANTRGGGMQNDGGSPTLINVTFAGNRVNKFGGGMYNFSGSAPTLTNVTFAANQAEFGGGIYNISGSEPILTNVTFAGNQAKNFGGGMSNIDTDPTLTNVVMWNNTPNSITNPNSSPTITYSLVEGLDPAGEGNLDGTNPANNPLFADPDDPAGPDNIFGTDDDGLRLQATSPAINAGDPETNLSLFSGGPDNPLDLAGEPRVFDDSNPDTEDLIDMGAYEFQNLPETPLTLTMREGWRMLSSPIAGQSYADMLEPLWTQGVDGADYSGGEPNVYTWNTGYTGDCTTEYELGQECEGWEVPSSDAFAEAITPGTGFLVYVFADDEYGETEEDPFPKDLTLTGTRHSGQVSPEINQNGAGWTLVGNPYGSPIDFARVDRTAVQDIAYVYDANADPDAVPDDGPTNGNGGAWRSTVDGTYGDITDGIIAPGQGFFVQSSMDDAAELIFSPSDQIDGGEFYGKEKQRRDFVRLEVQGESLYNSAWIRFSEEGSLERTEGEALELQPLDSHYALLGARKADGVLMDIAHYPLDTQELEIPLAVEATQSGEFTIQATDLDLPAGMALYLYDRQRGESMPITDTSFEYSFTIDKLAIENSSPSADGGAKGGLPLAQNATPQQILAAGAIGPSKATTTGTDRFLITTTPGGPQSELPDEVALGQNYPNPFNPATVIRYQLPVSSQVRLEVYDMLGRRVATLVDEQVAAGRHQVNFDASRLSSGVYLYRLNARGADGGSQIFTKKLTLIK